MTRPRRRGPARAFGPHDPGYGQTRGLIPVAASGAFASLLSGCAIAPGDAGIPIVPMIMIPVGVLLIGWGLTMIPSRGEGETPPEEPGEEARETKDG